jgi:hypothetical protein
MTGGVLVGLVVTNVFLAPVSDVIRGIRAGSADWAPSHPMGESLRDYLLDARSIPEQLLSDRWWTLIAAAGSGQDNSAAPHWRVLSAHGS